MMYLYDKMNVVFLNALIIFLQIIDFIMPFLCNNTQNYWCQRSGYGLKYSDLSSKENEYSSCIHFCHGNTTCKAFDYDRDQKICRFTSNLLQNVELKMTHDYELFWKTYINKTCAWELDSGKVFSQDSGKNKCLSVENL